ncbi:MAG: hypothetical protein M3220_08430 [Chloroflexota bacterium]|nr:hypothetical protein [Chloroflexota bacterium]
MMVNPPAPPRTLDWLIGEILTNLYVGLGRFRRGEKLSACRFIQGYAIDRIVELSQLIETERSLSADPFLLERRYEFRFPTVAKELPRFMQGYDRSPESAKAILDFLEKHVEVNPSIKQAILTLCEVDG